MSDTEHPAAPLDRVVLRPEPGLAAWWSLLGALLVAAGAWLVVDTGGALVAWLLLLVFAGAAGYFAAQLVSPDAVVTVLERDGLHASVLGWTTSVAWDRVHLARVTRLFGDPVLELHVIDRPVPVGTTPPATRLRRVLLPVGCDLAALHRFLGERLGGPGLRAPGGSAGVP